MDENRFLSLMRKARNYSYLHGDPDYWHGYQRGLRRGFHGELFGTDDEHNRWVRLADEGRDQASRDRGRGYRDGLEACVVATEGSPIARSMQGRDADSEVQANLFNPRRR
jgi:hypothetical protein